MKISELQAEICRLKQERDMCILAHSYVATEIQEIADFTGDSYALSVKATTVSQQNVLMCGVRFMAETVKILSPQKRVLLSVPNAGCPMAEQLAVSELQALKAQYPKATVVAYVNTTAALKAISDVCVTSSSAVQIVKHIPADEILFIPDCNLGAYVQAAVPEKQFHFIDGGCPVHRMVTEADVLAAKAAHPDALVLVHPECKPEVCKHADYIGSTTGIMQFARTADASAFIIGTEISIAELLQYEMPERQFYPLKKELICENMKATTLMDVYHCLNGTGGEEIQLPEETLLAARGCIDRMIALGG
ncbi:MAG: quinolinate synthase NadA [Oscillospiraceae bacterium]|nr:quinolinate synthase NadA [Oscillospiraceae bacterium]MDD7295237.1 quinolinate synthase NadA [Oscillospiraceae bacterium]MDY2509905.1 quinolinate synthase NadA [Ruminococcus callidus]